MQIRLMNDADRPALWSAMQEAVRHGETLAVPMDATPDEAVDWWTASKEAVFVAEIDGAVVGSYYLKPNQAGNASHIANAGYVVGEIGRGRGVATALCTHSLDEARRRGYLAMQFNFVVETNETAIRLWRKMGFQILTTIPRAFRHPTKGMVGAHVMWQSLEESPGNP